MGKNDIDIDEKQLREIYDEMPVNYQSLDAKGNILRVNNFWLKTLGYSKKEVIGKWFGVFLTAEYAELFKQRFPLFIANKIIHDIDFDMQHKNGNVIHVSYEGRVIEDENGHFKYTHCIFKNISNHVEIKNQLEEQNKILRQFNKLSIDREMKMMDLKNKIKSLEKSSKNNKK